MNAEEEIDDDLDSQLTFSNYLQFISRQNQLLMVFETIQSELQSVKSVRKEKLSVVFA